MESLQGKHFSITDPKNVNTVIYQVNKTNKKEVLNGAPKFTIERLDFAEELRDNASKKTFFVDNPKEDGNQLIILSFANNSASANSSKKLASFEKEVEKIKLVMGPFSAVLNDKEYTLKMDPEYARTYTEQMAELAIPVGTYTKVLDKNGKITKRIDDKTGKVLDSDKNKEER